MADQKAVPDKMSPDTSTTKPLEQSQFTFSAPGPAPARGFFHSTPVEKPSHRNWLATAARMREAPGAPPEPPEMPVDTTTRPIASYRGKQPLKDEREKQREAQREEQREEQKKRERKLREEQARAEASKEGRNVERLQKENAAKQQTIEDLKHTITEVLRSGEACENWVTEQDKIIKQLREENDSIRKYNLEAKMAEEKLAEQEALIADLQKRKEAAEEEKDRAVEMAAKQPTTEMQELQSSNERLEHRNEGLNGEIDAMRVRLDAAEKKLSQTSASYRHAQVAITNNNATISSLEQHIDEVQKELNGLEQEVANRDTRIRLKDDNLRDALAEIASLSSLNKDIQKENRRIKSQNEKLELQAQHNNAEIAALREASRDYLELETALAEAQATTTQLREEILLLEQSNTELSARPEDYTPFPRTRGTTSNLESELSETDFHGTEHETILTTNDLNTGATFSEITAPSETTASGEPAESHEAHQTLRVTTPAEVVTSPVVPGPPDATQSTPVTESSALTESPEVTQALEVTIPLDSTQSQAASQTIRFNPPLTVVLKSHNPLECWLQVYVDLWTLFIFWLNHHLTILLGGRNTAFSSDSVAQSGRNALVGSSSSSNKDAPLPATALGSVTSVITTTTLSPTGHVEPDQEPPDIWITIFALGLHVLFYTVIIVCISNYRAVVHERYIWFSANEITRQYLCKFYKAPLNREYGIFHELFGPVTSLDVWWYNVHYWAGINLSFPG